MCSADVLVSPEPLTPPNAVSTSIKVGEYMAMGRPVVASDLPESRYTAQEAAAYVTPGDAVKLGDAIAALMDNPQKRQSMGEAGRRRVSDVLCWEHQSENLLRAYQLALGA